MLIGAAHVVKHLHVTPPFIYNLSPIFIDMEPVEANSVSLTKIILDRCNWRVDRHFNNESVIKQW